MPGRDRTGPNGGGPMTGRGTGLCGGKETVGRRCRCSAGPGARRRGFRYRDRIDRDYDENDLTRFRIVRVTWRRSLKRLMQESSI